MFMETGFSRLPVYEGDLDKILGVLNQKDFHNYISGSKKTISDYVKPVIYVAGSMKAADLLKKLQVNKCHIAIIVDEYGGTAGLLTMEDVVEEIVGEIEDEFDDEEEDIEVVKEDEFVVDGSTRLEDLNEMIGCELISEEVDTIAGYVLLVLGNFPKDGEEIETDGLRIVVEDMEKNRIGKLRIYKIPHTEEETDTEE